jgi:hypothetical protein
MESPSSPDVPPHDASAREAHRMERRLRSEALWLREAPAPDVAARVRVSLNRRAAGATDARHATAPVASARVRTHRRLTPLRLFLAVGSAAGLLAIAMLSDPTDGTRPAGPMTAVGHAPAPTRDSTATPVWKDLQVHFGLPLGNEPLQLSSRIEAPLLDEVADLRHDAERAATLMLAPLVQTLVRLQLRPSFQADDAALATDR